MNERLSPLSLLCLIIVSNELLKAGVTSHSLQCGLLHPSQKVYRNVSQEIQGRKAWKQHLFPEMVEESVEGRSQVLRFLLQNS